MTTQPDARPESGRPVTLTPVQPGLWLVIGGAIVAALGPLFGFLLGSILGSDLDADGLSPIYLWLFIGFVVGGIGIAMLLVGVRRMLRLRAAQG